MLATPGALPDGPEWLFEVKWDGLRLLADVTLGKVTLTNGNGRDLTAMFPELAELPALAPDLLLDGEVVLLEHGVPSFAALADRMQGPVTPRSRQITFMVFDVLRLYGVDLQDRPYVERRGTLERLELDNVAALSLSPGYTDGPTLLEITRERGLEGVVAKRKASPYRPGERSPDWRATAHHQTQACVVGGWVADRTRIGALLLGIPDGRGLRYVGRLGAGLADAQAPLQDRLVAADRSPFATPPPRAEQSGVRWCAPLTVVEVRHSGWSGAGRLRSPVFRGVRDDLDPAQLTVDG